MKITTGLITVLVVAFLVLVIIIGLLIYTGHDAGAFVAQIGVLLTAVAGFVTLLISQNKQGEKIDQQSADLGIVKTNTNGTLTAYKTQLDSTMAKLNQALARLDPEHAQDVLSSTITREEADRLVTAAAPDTVTEPAP